jgi:hypothetical protein
LEFVLTCLANASHSQTKQKQLSVEDKINKVQVQR